jgi:hypothetical protein
MPNRESAPRFRYEEGIAKALCASATAAGIAKALCASATGARVVRALRFADTKKRGPGEGAPLG